MTRDVRCTRCGAILSVDRAGRPLWSEDSDGDCRHPETRPLPVRLRWHV
jgi:hypothetical protein